MATIDSSIPLAVKPVQIESPMNALAQFAQLQGAQQQNALLTFKMQEAQRARDDDIATRTALADPKADVANVLLGRGKVTESIAYTKGQREAEKAKVDLQNQVVEAYRDAAQGINDPQSAAAFVSSMHKDPRLKDSVISQVPLEQVLAKIPQDPAQFGAWKQEFALGAKKFIELNKPTTSVVNAGGTSQITQTPGLGGAPQVVGTVAHTATPGELLTDTRARQTAAETARHHGVIETQGAANLSKPFEVTDPDTGKAVLVQQDKQGNLAPVAGYAPKGGGKPLPQGALKEISEVRDNANTIERLSSSFKKDYAGKGVLGMGADAQLAASGVVGADKDAVEWWKNYRKQAELVERHALFGAALTPGEQTSWRSADISPGMHPDVIERNLATRNALAKQVLEFKRQDLIDAGHSPERVNAIAGRGPGGSTGNTAAPAAAPAGGLSPAEQKELDALRKRFKK